MHQLDTLVLHIIWARGAIKAQIGPMLVDMRDGIQGTMIM